MELWEKSQDRQSFRDAFSPYGLFAGVLAVNVFVILLVGMILYRGWTEVHDRALDTAISQSRIIEEHILGLIEKIDLAVLSVDDELQRQEATGQTDRKAIESFIRRVDGRLADTLGIRVHDANAMVDYAVTGVTNSEQANVRDRDYFQRLRDNAAAELVVSQPMVGRISGSWIVAFARRRHHHDGSFAGSIHVAVPVDRFLAGLPDLSLGLQGMMAVYTDGVSIIDSRPDKDSFGHSTIGRINRSPEFRAILASGGQRGSYHAASGIDNIVRLVSVRRLAPYPLYLAVGLADDDFLTEWRREASLLTILTCLFLMGSFAAAALYFRRWRRQFEQHQATIIADAHRTADLEKTNNSLSESEVALRLREARLRAMFEFLPIGLAHITLDGQFREANWAFLDMLGYSMSELRERSCGDLTPDSYRQEDDRHHDLLRVQRRFGPYDKEYRHKSGRKVAVRLTGTMVTETSGENTVWMTIEDIGDRRRRDAEHQLSVSVFENTVEAIVVTDASAQVITVNPAFSDMTGFAPHEIIGKTPRVIKSDRQEADFYKAIWEKLLTEGKWQGQIWNRRKDGEAFLASQTISAVRDANGAVTHFVSIFTDITDLHQKDAQLRHHAYHDALTGLPNRLLLQDRLGHALEVARRTAEAVAVIFIDLDRFKVVNDNLGHDVGDLLLIEVAERLQNCLRRSDSVARLGGDEFVAVLANFNSVGEVAEVAEKIVNRLSEPAIIKGHPLTVGASVGIAMFPQDGGDVTTLMKDADAAMYRAKKNGRSAFCFFDAGTDGAAAERLSLEIALRRALDLGEFELYFQPKLDLHTGDCWGAEALIRWNSPERGLVMPGQFIPIAEESGQILAIGHWVIQEACRQLAAWRDAGTSRLKLSVNLSARQFIDQSLSASLENLLDRHHLDPAQLELELTESTVMSDPDLAIKQLVKLRGTNIPIAIDDFGTGYSSLADLKRLPIHTLKIDQSFVRRIDQEADNAAIVTAIVGLSKALGMTVIAEGVETEEEERHLLEAGCRYAQGFRYCPPLPLAQFEDWLVSHRRTRAAGQ